MRCPPVGALTVVVFGLVGCNPKSPPPVTSLPPDAGAADRGAGTGGAGAGGNGGAGAGGSSGASTDAAGVAGVDQAVTAPDAGRDASGAGEVRSTPDVGDSAGGDRGPGCPAGALLCDDFESYATAANLAPRWTVTTSGGSVAVDATRVFGGAKALHLTTMGGGDNRTAALTKQGAPLFPLPGNAFFGRMMVWLDQMPTGAVHWNNVQASGLVPGSTATAKFGFGGMFARLMTGYVLREGGAIRVDCSSSAPSGIPEKRWVCVEWQFDGAKDELHHWLDGRSVTEIDVVKTGMTCVNGQSPPDGVWHSPTFSTLILGWQHYQPTPVAVDMWIDDLVLSSQRIGCPAP